jgi:cytochrome c biogenesis protein CcdA
MAGLSQGAAALVALVLTLTAPLRLSVSILGAAVQFPAGWLILAAGLVTVAALAWLAVRILRPFRSWPFPRRAES